MADKITQKDVSDIDIYGAIRDSAEKTTLSVTAMNEELKTTSKILAESLKANTKTTQKEISNYVAQSKALNDLANKVVENNKKIVVAEKARTISQKEMDSAVASLQRQREKGIKQMEREAQKAKEAERPYNKMSATLNQLRKDYKDLAVSGNENSTSARKMKREIDALDKTLKRTDASVGQYQRSVGNYSQAFGKLSGVLNTFGISVGVGLIGSKFVETLTEYEDAVASFRTIVSDATDVEFAKYKGEINSVANDTKKSTTEIAKSFEKIAGLNSDFAETSEGLGLVSKAVSTLSKASNDEMAPSAENLVGIMNQFDLSAKEADRTINVLAAGQAVGASSITQSAEAYKNFGAVAKGANISLEKSQALIQVLGKSSIFGAEAGTKLRGVTLQLQKANLGYASGQFDINDALTEFNKKLETKTSASEKDAYTTKIFGAENITAGKIISSNIPLLDKFTKSVTGTAEAQKAAEINSNTLTNRWAELKDRVTTMVTSNATATNSLNGVKDALKFVADNLPEIISLIGKLTFAFITFKGVMATMNLVDRVKDFKGLGSAVKDASGNITEAGKSAKGFGQALKGVGWTVAIGFAIELVQQFYELYTGAEQVREQMEAIEKAGKRGSKTADALIDKRRKSIDIYKQEQDLLLADGKITQKVYDERVKAKEKEFQEKTKWDIRFSNEAKERAKKEAQEIATALNVLENRDFSTPEKLKEWKDAEKFINGFTNGAKGAHNQIDFLKTVITEENAMLTVLNGSLKESRGATDEMTLSQKKLAKESKSTKKELEDYTQRVKELNDELINDEQTRVETKLKTKLAQDLASIKASGIKAQELRVALEKQFNEEIIKIQKDFNEKKIQANQEYWDEIKAQQQKAQDEADALNKLNYDKEIEGIELLSKQKELEWLNSDMTEQEIEEERLKRRKKVLQETIEAGEEFDQKVIDAQIELAQMEQDIENKKAEERKKRIEDIKAGLVDVADKAIEEYKRRSEAEEGFIDKRIEAEKQLQSNLQAQANAGNINAEKSIQASKEAEIKATQEKQKEAKKREVVEQVQMLYKSINSYLDQGDKLPIAVGKAGVGVALAKSTASILGKFYGGTKGRLGDEDKAIHGGKDGHLIMADKKEFIVGAEDSDKLVQNGITKTKDIVHNAIMYQNISKKGGVSGTSISQAGVISELRELKQVIKEQPHFELDPIIIDGIVKGVVAKQSKGNINRLTKYLS